MKQSIGYATKINIIMVFILLVFAFIFVSYSYSKAFRASSKIINAIEKNEGYNNLAINTFERDLFSLGYEPGSSEKCKKTRTSKGITGKLVKTGKEKFKYCVYEFDNSKEKYYTYGVVTYINFEFTMFNIKLDVPIYGKTRNIYKF